MNPFLFGINVGVWMKSVGMSQNVMSEKTGLTKCGISQIVRGLRVPTLATVIRMLEIVPLTFEQLIEEKKNP